MLHRIAHERHLEVELLRQPEEPQGILVPEHRRFVDDYMAIPQGVLQLLIEQEVSDRLCIREAILMQHIDGIGGGGEEADALAPHCHAGGVGLEHIRLAASGRPEQHVIAVLRVQKPASRRPLAVIERLAVRPLA